MTSENLPPTGLLPMELPSMRSAAGSPARTSATLAGRLALRVSEAVYGQSMPASLANYDPVSSSWRTSQRCLVEGWTVFSETWPRSGMMRSGIAYQLAPLAPLISGTGSGLWPTPSAHFITASSTAHAAHRAASMSRGLPLAEMVRLWPTPSAGDDRDRGNLSTPAIQRRMAKGKQLNLSMVVSDQSGALNPTWVEKLMGFPTGWTDMSGGR